MRAVDERLLRRAVVFRSLAPVVFLAALCPACGQGTMPDSSTSDAADIAGRDSQADGTATDVPADAGPCASDIDCSDRVFCNGTERCQPGATGADTRGCVAADPPSPCLATQHCDEAAQRCASSCAHDPDADGDGHRSTDCGGDDCDDADPNRFPGRTEVCDANNHDEDCDARTFGFRDGDMDSYADAQCCNTDSSGAMHCGDDCNDSRPNVHPGLAESCDGLDNDCNARVDEGVQRTFHPDTDLDSFGNSSGAPMTGCVPPAGYAEANGDCDDMNSAVHPGAQELCDGAMVDENCDGVTNPASLCACSGDVSRMCMQPGVCSSGTERCVNGGWGSCSIIPVAEICNGVDDDCDGSIDEGLSVTCYPDGDNDGYAQSGATSVHSCPVAGRDSFAGCPPNQTNRPPLGGEIDCNDSDSTVSPGVPELCDASMRDENCDGVVNPASLCNCTDGATRPCMASGSCGAGIQTCSAGHWGACSVNPVTESCNGIDDNCNGAVDEGLTITCYADLDNDGYAAVSAMPMQSCPVNGRDSVGGCPTNQTNRAPLGSAIDCDDVHAARSPAGLEVCDGVDNDCNGMIDEAGGRTFYLDADMDGFGVVATTTMSCALPSGYADRAGDCADNNAAVNPAAFERCDGVDNNCDGATDTGCSCTDGMSRPCGMSSTGACRMGSQVCVGGTWSTCAGNVDPTAEVCNGLDDNCNGTVDEMLTVSCYSDGDADGYGIGSASRACRDSTRASFGYCPTGFAATGGDCDDTVASIHPGATETCNGIDDSCDGRIDDGVSVTPCYADGDGDGYGTGAAQSRCRDATRSAFGYCPTGFTNVATDCNDASNAVHPGAAESCNGIDDDCDGSVDDGVVAMGCFDDGDGDGYGTGSPTTRCRDATRMAFGYCPVRSSNVAGDCNDSNAAIHPGVVEACNAVDDNCSGAADEGFTCVRGATRTGTGNYGSCAGIAGVYTCNSTCTAETFTTTPPPETCDGRDNDCNGVSDDVFACVQNSIANPCTTTCGTVGSRTCNATCNGYTGACVAAAETCNNCDDNGNAMVDEGFACRQFATRSCTTTCTTAGTQRCLGDCSGFDACRAATETCNGCDDDLDGAPDDGLTCVQGHTYACTVPTCNTAGTQVCNATCNGYSNCSAATETCNYCDDNRNGVFYDEEPAATGYGLSPVFNCASMYNPGGAALTCPTISPPMMFSHETAQLCLNGGAWCIGNAFARNSMRLGYGRMLVEAVMIVRSAPPAVPGYGWAIVLSQMPRFGNNANAVGVSPMQAGLSIEWRFNSALPPSPLDQADFITVRQLNNTATFAAPLATATVPAGLPDAPRLDNTGGNYILQYVNVIYTPDDQNTIATNEQRLRVETGLNHTTLIDIPLTGSIFPQTSSVYVGFTSSADGTYTNEVNAGLNVTSIVGTDADFFVERFNVCPGFP